MKLGVFRLGNSLLYINKNRNELSIFYISITNNSNNNNNNQYIYIYVCWDIYTNKILSENGKYHKKLIFD